MSISKKDPSFASPPGRATKGKEKKTSWGGVAGWYDELLEQNTDSYQEKVILPNILRIIDPQKGMNLIDIACGQGYFSRAFAEKGATVTGCDISKELIDVAKTREPQNISYYAAPAEALPSETGSREFDVAVIVLALQNIEGLSQAFAEASRVLKSGGRFVIVLNHPAFRIPKKSSWEWDATTSTQYRRIDNYMSDSQTNIDMTPGEKKANDKKFTVSFHRPLQTYFKEFAKNGFSVTRLEEWISHRKSQDGPRGAEEDRMRKEIPMFICIEAKKN